MADGFKYDAFISYKHCDPDSEIASKLHKKLESFRLPKAIAKKIGRRRLNKVFRDNEELAVSDDLSEEIDRALRNSEYLIAVCSPQYLTSIWCMKEIQTFLRHSDRWHVLLVLADGEPETAFPPVMLYEDYYRTEADGNKTLVRIKSEPLAADCRSDDPRERNAKIDIAVTRLIAAMLNVGYDDLVRRQRRERTLRWARRALTALGVLVAIIAICVFFLVKIARQNALIKQRYADTLAQTSINLLSDGRRMDAVYAARIALSDMDEENFSEPAVQALVKALGLYNTQGFGFDRNIPLPSAANTFYISPGGRYLGLMGLDRNIYMIDLDNGEEVFSFTPYEQPEGEESYADLCYDGDRGIVFTKDNVNYSYFDLQTLTESSLGSGMYYPLSDPYGNGYLFHYDDHLAFYKGRAHIYDLYYSEMIGYLPDRFDVIADYTQKGIIYTYISDYDLACTYVIATDPLEGTSQMIYVPDYYDIMWEPDSDGDLLAWNIYTDDGERLYLMELNGSGTVKSTLLNVSYISDIVISDGYVLVLSDNTIYIYDSDLVYQNEARSKSYVYRCEDTSEGAAFYAYSNGVFIVNDGEVSHLNPELSSTSLAITSYSSGTLYVANVGDNTVSTYTKMSSDYLIPFYGEYKDVEYYGYDDSRAADLRDEILEGQDDLDENSIYNSVRCENGDMLLIQTWDGTVRIYDTGTLTCVKTIYSMDGFADTFYWDEENQCYYISAGNFEVFDSNFRKMFDIKDSRQIGIDEDTNCPVIISGGYTDDEQLFTEEHYFLVKPVTYEEVIDLSDEILDGYEPDQRVREKYSLEG